TARVRARGAHPIRCRDGEGGGLLRFLGRYELLGGELRGRCEFLERAAVEVLGRGEGGARQGRRIGLGGRGGLPRRAGERQLEPVLEGAAQGVHAHGLREQRVHARVLAAGAVHVLRVRAERQNGQAGEGLP